MKMRFLLAASLLAAAPLAANAANFDYNYVEGGYVNYDFDGPGSENGLQIGGSFAVNRNVYVAADYADLDNQNIFKGGVGYALPLNRSLDLYGQVNYVDFDYNNDGLGLTGGLRAQVSNRVELGGGFNYYDVDPDSETSVFVNGLVGIAKQLDLKVELESADHWDKLMVGVRYNF